MMKKILKAALLIALPAMIAIPCRAQEGLSFKGMDHPIEKRTSYSVFGRTAKTFEDSLRLDFGMRVTLPNEFGYIVRVESARDGRKWNLSYDAKHDDIIQLRLNEEGYSSLIKADIPAAEMPFGHWHSISLVFNMADSLVTMSVDSLQFKASADLPSRLKASISFGRSGHLIDVPSFEIDSLRVGGGRGGRIYCFPLGQREGKKVWDSKKMILGHVEEPVWMASEFVDWREVLGSSAEIVAKTVLNPVRKEIYYFTEKDILIYDLKTSENRRVRYSNPCPTTMVEGNAYVSQDGNSLWCYEVTDAFSDVTASRLDLDTMEWEACGISSIDVPLFHHCGFFHPQTGEWTIYGGFGNMVYNGSFYALNSVTGEWKEIEVPSEGLCPRYFSAACTDGNTIYIYGGMGNESGEQVVGRRYFYDLYAIDVEKGTCTKLWSSQPEEYDTVPAATMVVGGGYLYAICYPEYLSNSHFSLYKFSLKDGSCTKLGNPLPLVSDKMNTRVDLFRDDDLKKLYAAMTEYSANDEASRLKIWSMAFPPMTRKEYLAASRTTVIGRRGLIGIGCSILLVVLIVLVSIWVSRRRKLAASLPGYLSKKGIRNPYVQPIKPDSIYLFGDFIVTDHEGNDIAPSITPQQKLILCLLCSRLDRKGISSKTLSGILWPDKDEDKVKNSRGVAINGLRRALEPVQGVSVQFAEGRYQLVLEGDAYCDYAEFLQARQGDDKSSAALMRVCGRGKFLKAVDNEVFDKIRDEVDSRVIELMYEGLAYYAEHSAWTERIYVADTILATDPMDEQATIAKVNSLKKLRRHDEASSVWSDFVARYRSDYGEDFSLKYNDV